MRPRPSAGKVQRMRTQRNKRNGCIHHLLVLLASARTDGGRRAVHLKLHMYIGRVVLDPRQIGCVPSQLVLSGAHRIIILGCHCPLHIIYLTGCILGLLDRQVARGFGSSELSVRKFVLQLDVSEMKRKSLCSYSLPAQDASFRFPSVAVQFFSGLDLWG